MSKVVATGKTIEEAVERGMTQLGVNRDRVTVNVLELTLIAEPVSTPAASAPPVPQQSARESKQEAIGGVTRQDSGQPGEEAYQQAVRFIVDVASSMGLTVEVEVVHSKELTTLQISGPDLGLVIGRRGQTLDALQYLANIVANRYSDSFIRLVLDAENFRERRKKTLEELADRLAGRVVRTRKEVVLEPMSPQERKIIHSRLQDHKQVNTLSKGDEPNRRVVITLK
jgi:spoIIIJ-associated protein